jgi:hypothetical protein
MFFHVCDTEEKKKRLKNRPNVIYFTKIIFGLNWSSFRESSGICGDILPHDRILTVAYVLLWFVSCFCAGHVILEKTTKVIRSILHEHLALGRVI